ncbi:probable sarcosine oxidase [Hordeum vulgare subsp. vulgare]|uniref:FAD dependent oxidoreductase domain-containing protein n=1 Tax=Hordeum vulgare subsp. vulgare TaxID=112509 RepID=A0A8I7B9F0_HORVV|nr:probable sarcosine oxidase [Hordeum vulgare subsp. vulgare]
MAAQPAGRSFDVIVVGAGIMGSCAAHAAASRGARVLLLEQFDLLHQRGSSHGESRTIRATYPQPHYPPMVRLSRRLWDDAQRDSGYAVLTPTRHVDLGPRDDPAFLASVANGGATVLAPAAADAPRPAWAEAFKVPDGWAAASSELGGVMKATKAVAMFQALAAKMGAVVRDRAEVVDVAARKPGEGTTAIVVKTASGEEFHGGKCIITVGAWTSKLVKAVTGAGLPVQPLHTVICYWKVKPGHERELTTEGGFPTFASYGVPYIYSTPSMEYPGLIKIAMHGGPACDPDGRDWAVGPGEDGLVEPVARWIEEVMPGRVETAGGPVIRQPCMYSMTPDEDFVIDFLGGDEFGRDVVVGAGFSGHGFKMGPAVGRILAEMALDGESGTAAEAGVELRHFSIGRFDGNPTGNARGF